MDYFNKIKKPLLIGALVSFALIVALLVFADFKEVMLVYARMDLRFLPLILLLAPLNYLLRFVKWNYYLKISHISPQPRMNRYIFLSGLSMTITPGKLGELLKCYLLKEHMDAPVSKTSSIVIAERVTDALGMVLLLACSLLAYPFGKTLLPVCAALLLAFILFFRFDQPINYLQKKFAAPGNIKYLTKSIHFLAAFQQNSKVLLAPRCLLFATTISFISWGFEGFIVYFAAMALGGQISVLGSVFVVSFSSLLGAVSFLPGGLGVAEGSIMTILILTGMSSEMAAAVTIITRFSTLWLGVIIGVAGLALVQRELSRQKKVYQEKGSVD